MEENPTFYGIGEAGDQGAGIDPPRGIGYGSGYGDGVGDGFNYGDGFGNGYGYGSNECEA